MIIRLIELENFLNHRELRLVLPECGLIHFSGRSTAGKSSIIVDAVGYALFGHFATRARSAKELRTLGAPGKDMIVRITWQMPDGAKMTVERGIDESGKAIAAGWDDAGGQADGSTTLKRYLRERIGSLTWETYKRSYVAMQKDLESLSRLKGAERKAFIHNLLGIGDLDALMKSLAKRESAISQVIQQLELSTGGLVFADLETKREKLEESAQKIHQKLTESKEAIAEKEKEADKLESQLGPLKERAEAWQRESTNHKVMTGRRPDLEAKVKRLSTDAEQAKEYQDIVAKETEVVEQGTQLKKKIDELTSLREASTRRKDIQNRVERYRSEKDQVKKELNENKVENAPDRSVAQISEELARIREQGKSARTRREELAANKNQLLDEGVCSTCLRPIEGEGRESLENRFDSQIAELDESLEKMTQAYKKNEKDLPLAKQAEEADKKLSQGKIRMEHLEKELESAQSSLSGLPEGACDEDQLEQVKTAYEEAVEAFREIKHASKWLEAHASIDEELSQARQELEQIDKAITDTSKWLKEASHDPDEYDRLIKQERECRRAAATTQERVSEWEREAGEIKKEIASLDEQMKLHETEAARLTESREKKSRVARLAELVAKFRVNLVNEIRPQLEVMCSQIMDQLSGGQTQKVEISPEYELKTDHKSGEKLSWHMLSGGEDSRGNLALRLALSRLISQRAGAPMRYLVLDEVLGSSDADHRQEIVNLLRSLQAFYPQIFIIDHVGELVAGSLVDYEVAVTKNEDGTPNVELYAC